MSSKEQQSNKALSSDQILLGGQAVIEGVMMRGPQSIATAVRRRDGVIVVHKEAFIPLTRRYRIWRFPILRGVAGFFEMTVLGIRMLNFSADVAIHDGEPEGEEAKVGEKHGKGAGGWSLALAVLVSLTVAVGLFFVVPILLATTLFSVSQDPLVFNFAAGSIRLLIFLSYLALIARIPDVRRLFMYHGAEHMTVFAFEREKTVTAEAASRQSRFHPRCGTSFLLIVVFASIVLFSLVDAVILYSTGSITLPLRLLWHLLLLPLVAGSSYEVIRFSARHAETVLGRLIMKPGLLLQRLTTRVPTEDQLEVAVAALQAALEQTQDLPVAQAEAGSGESLRVAALG
ncbi:MAG: DUF1385 domain-containing protein [Bacteroidota bacterium]